MANPKPAVVLLSGGLDSATALAVARRDGFECHAFSVDYGQRHRAELRAAQRVAKQLHARSHRTITLDLRAVGGSALTSDTAVPKDRPAHDIAHGIPITYVPARNMTFLSLAVGLAEVLHARDIYIGVNAVDYSGYPDCRREFIDAFTAAANLGTKVGVEATAAHQTGFKVHTPLDALTKAQIITLGTSLGVDFSLTSSCYDPIETPDADLACGRCDSCQIRRAGFQTAHLPDPTRYAPN